MVAPEERLQDGREVSRLDERFHCLLLEGAGNREMARLHAEVSEKIRIIRRLDFTQGPRVELTYEEHARILGAILSRRCEEAQLLLKTHIEVSKAEVRKITLHMLHSARQRSLATQG
ncbi:transcriptional regulator NanR [compost metagenome]